MEVDGSVLAMIPITANEVGTRNGGDAGLTVVVAEDSVELSCVVHCISPLFLLKSTVCANYEIRTHGI